MSVRGLSADLTEFRGAYAKLEDATFGHADQIDDVRPEGQYPCGLAVQRHFQNGRHGKKSDQTGTQEQFARWTLARNPQVARQYRPTALTSQCFDPFGILHAGTTEFVAKGNDPMLPREQRIEPPRQCRWEVFVDEEFQAARGNPRRDSKRSASRTTPGVRSYSRATHRTLPSARIACAMTAVVRPRPATVG